MDFAISTHSGVQAQLDRLTSLSPGADILGLSRVTELLARLGNPHLSLPPVFHVAGTNGKGSTCAFLRAILEADGKTVHVYTSPHLVRFNERIRIAGKLIDDDALAAYLKRVLDIGENVGASFFEVTTAAAFLAFSEVPADACVIEVGLGGRLDATNVIADPAACGIAQLGIDHQAFLGDTAEVIAREKAGIAKPGRPLLTQQYSQSVNAAVADAARGAELLVAGDAWEWHADDLLRYRDRHGMLDIPSPTLAGAHQHGNLALAIAMIRHQHRISVAAESFLRAASAVRWPARMQRLNDGPLTALLPVGAEIWLDGGHNAAAAQAVANAVREQARGRPIHIVLGMLSNKDMLALIDAFAPIATSLIGVPVPNHDHHSPVMLAVAARQAGIANHAPAHTIPQALGSIANDYWTGSGIVLIAGSLYLAGEVLALNDEAPN